METGAQIGLQTGMEMGMLFGAREMVTEALSVRFSRIPGKIINAIDAIENRNILRGLLRKAILAQTMEEFETEFQEYAKG
ncbi:MAG: hypothetical protein WBN66_11120 [Smithella sp.]